VGNSRARKNNKQNKWADATDSSFRRASKNKGLSRETDLDADTEEEVATG